MTTENAPEPSAGDSKQLNLTEMWGDSAGKRRCFQRLHDAHVSYKRFRRRIVHRGRGEAPAASTPVTAGWRCGPSFEWDPVCQRLELESPPRHLEAPQSALRGNLDECVALTPLKTLRASSAKGNPDTENEPKQGWVWRAAAQAGSNKRTDNLPFAHLDKATDSPEGKLAMKLAAPSLLNDYYTNVLDCSCSGIIALALGSSVYLWDSETSTLVGSLGPSPQAGHSVSSVCWSRDGRLLCVGTRRGEIQLWNVEQERIMRCLPSHLSVVRALSWKQQLLSSGSALGRIHHLDVRAPTALVGVAVQKEGICSLQWSPGGDWLASGSAGGLLQIWDSDVAGLRRSHQPVSAMKQPSAVKAMGWCPWQRTVLATGGGWKDGELRLWNSQTGTCVTSVGTNSQICSLQWAQRESCLVTGHGLPHHQVRLWEFPSLELRCQLTGHSHRVLHVALKPDDTQIFSAGADQRLHIWDL